MRIAELWEKIFAVRQFDLTKDLHFITASEIKAISHAEPRLMAKFDTSHNVPPILRRNGYILLPVKNGTYAIVRGEGFHALESITSSSEFVSRVRFPLTTAGRGSSEMQYLDYSFNSGVLEHVVGHSPLYHSIRGREYSRAFRFRINRTTLSVSSVQLEVDSGFEGQDAIVLVEAKIDTPDDFIIRQLFYPYNHFRLVSPKKQIIPMFFTYEPRYKRYNFWIYEIPDQRDYNSVRLLTSTSIQIVEADALTIEDIKPHQIATVRDLIPQANDVNKIIELVFKVSEGIDDYKAVAKHFAFDERQSSYYREAAEALGLLRLHHNRYVLTDVGATLVELPVDKRNFFVAQLLSDFTLIRDGLAILRAQGVLAKSDIESLIRRTGRLSGSTISRRSGSLLSWFRWISQATGAFSAEHGAFRLNTKNAPAESERAS